MAIAAIVENLDEVDEKYRDLYTKKGEKYELTEVTGVRTQADVDRIQTALTKERNDHKKVKETLSKFDGLNPEEVREKLDKFPELEALATGKVDDKKIDDLVETRIKSRLAPIEREKGELVKKTQLLEGQIQEFTTREKRSKVNDAIRSAATKAKLLPEAIDDAILLGSQVLDLDENGEVRVRENTSFTNGIDPAVWLSEVQAKKPHWWAPSSGGGARGSGGNNSGSNPFSHDGWNMTEQGKLYKENPTRAAEMAKSAGTSIGGPRPAKK